MPSVKTPLSLSMLSWAYNEEENIADFIEKAIKLLESLTDDYELILINDASTDKTRQIAESYLKKYPRIRLINNPKNMNCGMNTRIAIANATKDVLFWQMVDWSYDLSNINLALEYLADPNIDVVQGVRVNLKEADYMKPLKKMGLFKKIKVSKRSDNLFKAVVSVTNYLLVRFLFKLPLNDFQNVTFYRRKLVQSVDFETSSSFTNPECLLKTFWKEAVIKEIPIDFIPRKKGTAKGTKFKSIIASIKNIFKYWFLWVVLGKRKDKGKGIIIPYYIHLTPYQTADLLISKFKGLVNSSMEKKLEAPVK